MVRWLNTAQKQPNEPSHLVPLTWCRVHHPHVPNDGVITQEHIDAITDRIQSLGT